jgi:hypothetical protein
LSYAEVKAIASGNTVDTSQNRTERRHLTSEVARTARILRKQEEDHFKVKW